MGLRLENSDVRLGFFRIGVTIASFQLEGKWPWRREELTIVVMTEEERQDTRRLAE